MKFVPLNCRSGYSFLQSGWTVSKMVGSALKKGFSHVGIADLGSFRGSPELEKLCLPRNITPVHGVAFALGEGTLVCYPSSEEGYRLLLSKVEKYSRNALTLDDFSSSEDGFCAVYDLGEAPFRNALPQEKKELASRLSEIARHFASFTLGLPRMEVYPELVAYIHDFVREFPYPLIAFPKMLYAKEEDAITVSILSSVNEGNTLDVKSHSGPFHFLSEAEANVSFFEEELLATFEFANRLSSFTFTKKRGKPISYPLNGLSAETALAKACMEGLAKKGLLQNPVYKERLDYELGVISSMGYCDYFLVVADYVAYAKNSGILVGPGRGSSAGSLVAFALGIVKADPIQYGLLFERFLNPSRHELPDIDVDFEDTRREEVIRYLAVKYGSNRVAHVMTTQSIMARQAVTDVGRVYGYPSTQVRLLSSSINPRWDLVENYKKNEAFHSLVDSDAYYKEFVSLAHKIEGLPRQSGLHAAGIVLNEEPLDSVLPITSDPSVGYVEQLDKDDLQDQGFYKMDLLGITNLSLIHHILDLIEEHHGVHLRYEDIPVDSPEAIALIARGETMGLFQLESPGMNRAIAEVKPTSLEDLCAILALFRPGPMENIPLFARRKAGKEKTTYLCPELEPILSSTYGVIVYQEQIMRILQVVAGFDLGKADIFRRAISHKDISAILAMKEEFLRGCQENGHEKEAPALYSFIEKFAGYGFNKSHSLSYAMLASQMAYLKAKYPLCFYCGLLDYGAGGKEKMPLLLRELKKKRIPFLLPSLNASTLQFSPCQDGILIPFSSIQGVPTGFASSVIDERIEHGEYADFFSFCLRTVHLGLTLPVLISLINAGAFDSLFPNRNSLRLTAPSAMRYAELFGGENSLLSSFGSEPPVYVDIASNKEEDLSNEKAVLGMMVSGSPLDRYAEAMQTQGIQKIGEMGDAPSLRVAGILSSCRAFSSRSGKKMAFLVLEDEVASVEAVVFEETYNESFPFLKEGNALSLVLQKDPRKEGKYIAKDIRLLSGAQS